MSGTAQCSGRARWAEGMSPGPPSSLLGHCLTLQSPLPSEAVALQPSSTALQCMSKPPLTQIRKGDKQDSLLSTPPVHCVSSPG